MTETRNPILALVEALIRFILYLLQWIRTLITFFTLTIPSMVVKMLGYSLTLQLDFTKLVILAGAGVLGVMFWVRYKYLNKYSQLKEDPLALPDPQLLNPSLTHADSFISPPAFHNYLDEFLSAIRIFGFLEKPVFHELSRHLQTKRLIAGDTISLDSEDKNFYCVVDGNVQVFARSTGENRNGFREDGPFNGYHLLNEVETGGTLSSLFTILSLFTEDVQLAWAGENTEEGEEEEEGQEPVDHTNVNGTGVEEGVLGESEPTSHSHISSPLSWMLEGGSPIEPPETNPDHQHPVSCMIRNHSRTHSHSHALNRSQSQSKRHRQTPGLGTQSRRNSDVSQLDADAMSTTIDGGPDRERVDVDGEFLTKTTGTGTGTDGRTASSSMASPSIRDVPLTYSNTDSLRPGPPMKSQSRMRSPGGASAASSGPKQGRGPPKDTNANTNSNTSKKEGMGRHQCQPGLDVRSTLARATVDTTLAVIPSEAFRRLTRKYPKSTGHIVSVILTRFSRVTFMTAHRYLGLTKEVLQAEDALNSTLSYPLPRAFYEKGGMKALRERFQPELAKSMNPSRADTPVFNVGLGPKVRDRDGTVGYDSPSEIDIREDYFAFEPGPGSNTATTPRNRPGQSQKSSPNITLTPKMQQRPSSAFSRQSTYRAQTANRKQVGAGDLLSMTMIGGGQDDGSYYRNKGFATRTPGPSPHISFNKDRSRNYDGFPTLTSFPKIPSIIDSSSRGGDDDDDNEIDLRDSIIVSIAESIGLVPMQYEHPTQSSGASVNFSTPGSPSSAPYGRGPQSTGAGEGSIKSPFGNLSMLDMLHSEHVKGIGGVSLDDRSSVTGTGVEGTSNGASDMTDLANDVEILYFKAGSTLVQEGENSPGLFFVIDGFLDVSMTVDSGKDASGAMFVNATKNTEGKEEELLYTVKPGGIAGYLASLCSTPSYTHIRAKTDCYVGLLPHKTLERLIETKPIVLLTLAKRMISLLSPLIMHLDASLDWMQLNSGQVLYREGEKSDSFYIVINGRLRSVNEKESGEVQLVTEYGQGSPIGELEAITGSARPNTVHAIRDSELVRMPMALFNAIAIQHPATTIRFLRLIASRVRKAGGNNQLSLRKEHPQHSLNTSGVNLNLKTVCVLPATRNIPITAFAERLRASLEDIGAPTAYLDQAGVMRQLGRHAFSKMGKLKVAGWLADQEQKYRIVLYVVDTAVSSQWTMTSIRQADYILVVGMGDEVGLGEYEKLLLASKTTARKELVILHPDRSVPPGSTRRWLQERSYVSAHHHVELPGLVLPTKHVPIIHDPAAVAAFKHLRGKVEDRIKKYRVRPIDRPRRPPHSNDFARLARRLCGKSIGVVLGGGGARGISHLGMLQAMEEFQIPVDAIGGCSIGAMVGGLYAREADLLSTTGRLKQFSGRMGSIWRILSDVTYPFASYTTGHEFNRGIYKAFYDVHIEDMWIPYFCNSTNIIQSKMEVHRTGYAWRYIRASMTLAGLLPPLSDGGNLLVDGGYVDNLPVSTMFSMGAPDVIAVDVGAIDDTSPRNYGDSVSGWWILLCRLNPFAEQPVLSMTEVSSRLTYVASVRPLMDAKATPGCLYTAMPVQQFETLGFSKFSEIYAVGLEAGRKALKEWKEQGKLPTGMVDDNVKGHRSVRRGERLRRMSI